MKQKLGAVLTAILMMVIPANFNAARALTSDTVILVLDASGSMAGAKMKSAKEVGQTFLTTVPTGIKVGLVTFNSNEVTVIPPTFNFETVSDGLKAVKPDGDTALYDGILSAINSIETGATARIVVLTDGDDTASKSLPKDVVEAIANSQVSLDVVTVGDATKEIDILKEFSTAGNGRLLQTKDAAQLADVFTKVLASAPAIPSPTVVESTPVVVAPDPVQETNFNLIRSLQIPISLALLFTLLIIGVRISRRRKRNSDLDQALETYAATAATEKTDAKFQPDYELSDQVNRKPKRLNLTPTKSQLFPSLAEKLDRAGIVISAERWVSYWVIAGLAMTLGLSLIADSLAVSLTFSVIGSALIQNSILKSREAALKREFEEQLADFLTIIASGLRAGLSFAQAVESAVGDGTGEVERQIRRALAEVQVGSTLDAALLRVAKKMNSDDLSWTIAALRIQREVGGNLSKILDTASVTIRNRAELKREIRTLSAEGRMSAYVLVALPVGIFGFLILSRRDYVKIFWTEPVGMFMLTMFLVLVTAGWFWIKSVVTVKV